MTAPAPVCPHCGSTNTMHGGYDRDDEGRLADTWQCRDCDNCWNTPVTDEQENRMSKEDRKASVKKHKDALAALHANQEREEAAGVRDETPEYQRLNGAVLEAEKNIPWYRR